MLICLKTLWCLQHVVDNFTNVWLQTQALEVQIYIFLNLETFSLSNFFLKFSFNWTQVVLLRLISQRRPNSICNKFISVSDRTCGEDFAIIFYCNKNLWENLNFGCDSLHILSFWVLFFFSFPFHFFFVDNLTFFFLLEERQERQCTGKCSGWGWGGVEDNLKTFFCFEDGEEVSQTYNEFMASKSLKNFTFAIIVQAREKQK